ncbi:MAG: 4-(cytidine 5'-diphospho)-2-C-methyl-D-erythritol kinase [Fimbriimonadales bacterium]
MKRLRIKAHAKINPVLAVGPLRPDGFHEVRTILQAIELHDVVEFAVAESLELTCSIPKLSGEMNLAWKALRLISELVDVPKLRIDIQKHIPLEAGLGGGSSDAAAVIRGVNEWLGGVLSKPDMLAVGAACGSDVPFFLLGKPRARASGRGEVLSIVAAAPPSPLVIVQGHDGMSTADAYRKLEEIDRPFRKWPGEDRFYNDFERVAECEALELFDRLLSRGADRALLCGSGSAVFGTFESEQIAAGVAARLRGEGMWAVATRTIDFFGEPEWTE